MVKRDLAYRDADLHLPLCCKAIITRNGIDRVDVIVAVVGAVI